MASIVDKNMCVGQIDQESVWDGISESWVVRRHSRIPIVENFLKDRTGSVLDFGCGSGRNMTNLSLRYVGVDFSKRQLEYARVFCKDVGISATFLKASLDEATLSETFDTGLFIAALHCIEHADARLKALQNFYKGLNVGGEALISVWRSDDPRFKDCGKEVYIGWSSDGQVFMRYYYLYEKEELIELLKEVGFEILKVFEYNNHSGQDRFSLRNSIVQVKRSY